MKIRKSPNLWQSFKYSKLYRLPMWLLNKLYFRNIDAKKKYQVKMRLGHKISLRPTARYLSNILISRQYHDLDIFFVDRIVPKNGVIIDIGANIGLYTCAFANVLKQKNCHVYAIEAIKKNYEFLKDNVEINSFSNVSAYRLALGYEEGELSFFLPSEDFVGNISGSNVLTKESRKDALKTEVEEIVPMTTLDSWVKKENLERCDFIKIDIEGAEFFAFQGGENFIKQCRPIIQCEYNKGWLQNIDLDLADYISFFDKLDYLIFVEDGPYFYKLNKTELDRFLVDLLFVPKEKVGLL